MKLHVQLLFQLVKALQKQIGLAQLSAQKTGSGVVNGTDYLRLSYEYYNAHKWRNWGITVGFVVLTEFNKGAMQKGEIVLSLRERLMVQLVWFSRSSSIRKRGIRDAKQ